MSELSQRQSKILKVVIEEYIDTAEPVGSQTLEKKFTLGISPATIRSEMVKLTEAGYLRQPHTSAGRVPTAAGFRFFIDGLMEEKQLSVTDEVSAREAVWDSRFKLDNLLRDATRALAQRTQALAVATTDEGDVYSAGYANILDMPEFFDIDVTRHVLSLLDEERKLGVIFEKAFGEDSIHILLGEDLKQELLETCSFVFIHFTAGKQQKGVLGVIGPCRLNYPKIIPVIRYFGQLVNDLTKNW